MLDVRDMQRAGTKKPRVVRGLRPPHVLLSKFEVFVLAETESFYYVVQR